MKMISHPLAALARLTRTHTDIFFAGELADKKSQRKITAQNAVFIRISNDYFFFCRSAEDNFTCLCVSVANLKSIFLANHQE
jgi:hypothetical protein